ncbi:MAG: hypothetical protein MK102_05340 [Fuerstiella sp.]|nr:hypothetical protein [Fuerstiella sp.]
MRTRLKLFVGDDSRQHEESTAPHAAMPLEDFARVIADAVAWDRTWLQDFADDQVIVSQDLYEIIRICDDSHQFRA